MIAHVVMLTFVLFIEPSWKISLGVNVGCMGGRLFLPLFHPTITLGQVGGCLHGSLFNSRRISLMITVIAFD